jgi:hypothetical protein
MKFKRLIRNSLEILRPASAPAAFESGTAGSARRVFSSGVTWVQEASSAGELITASFGFVLSIRISVLSAGLCRTCSWFFSVAQ